MIVGTGVAQRARAGHGPGLGRQRGIERPVGAAAPITAQLVNGWARSEAPDEPGKECRHHERDNQPERIQEVSATGG